MAFGGGPDDVVSSTPLMALHVHLGSNLNPLTQVRA